MRGRLDRRDARLTGSSPNFTRREHSYVGTTELLSREVRKNGDTATYDYNSRGERQGQRIPGQGGPTYRSYAKDALGSVIGLEDGDGTIPSDRSYSYDPYGELLDANPNNRDGRATRSRLRTSSRRSPRTTRSASRASTTTRACGPMTCTRGPTGPRSAAS